MDVIKLHPRHEPSFELDLTLFALYFQLDILHPQFQQIITRCVTSNKVLTLYPLEQSFTWGLFFLNFLKQLLNFDWKILEKILESKR